MTKEQIEKRKDPSTQSGGTPAQNTSKTKAKTNVAGGCIPAGGRSGGGCIPAAGNKDSGGCIPAGAPAASGAIGGSIPAGERPNRGAVGGCIPEDGRLNRDRPCLLTATQAKRIRHGLKDVNWDNVPPTAEGNGNQGVRRIILGSAGFDGGRTLTPFTK